MKKVIHLQGRQGDVWVRIPTKRRPLPGPAQLKELKPSDDGRVILAYGEATGHHHSVDAQCATLYDVETSLVQQLFGDKADVKVLEITEQTSIDHQEHGKIAIAPNRYWVVGQREYTPEEIRRVSD